ncbi:PAS domain-containing protein [Pseudodesulfovibrio cashew]|uniref:histidine kinase n=1 Tax=Pseudodesulfovibrio cashew TaxID=2678688 RepID=A0A6I6JFL3_9BACT|nr:PAS domain-containing sensor histidine kinase [Pseudodesulfovibrio cashew]QGY39969.1 PAS domain-containing protein [Pseudodesulfovibrio cashew]
MQDSKTPSEIYRIVLEGLQGTPETELLEANGITEAEHRRWKILFLSAARKGLETETSGLPGVAALLPAREANFAHLANSIPHAVFCKDLGGNFLYGNPAYCKAMHLSLEELRGKNDYDLHAPEAAKKYRSDDEWVAATGEIFNCQERHVRPDGGSKWIEVVKAPLRDEEGRTIGVMGMFWDITRQKEIERELCEASANLEYRVARRTEELLEANRRLEEGVKLKNDFMSAVSHELRTPLTSILGFASLIRRDAANVRTLTCETLPQTRRVITRMESNASIITDEGLRLKRLIDNLLDLEKIGSGKMTWNDEVFDLNEVARASAEAMKGQFAAKPQVELGHILYTDPIPVRADSDRIKQVFINLLNNAAKFTEKGRVELAVGIRDGRWAEARVTDTGRGISKQEIDRIFEQYYQGAQPLIQESGTGLGLPICHQIITHYGGKFWAESPEDGGASFHFLLPLHAGD